MLQALALIFVCKEAALSQPTAKNYKFAEYFDPPNETHLKFLLGGASARVETGGRTFLTEAKIQNFRLSGESEITVEAPQCLYESSNHVISSSGPLRIQTSDGKFFTEGEGFIWQQTNTTLRISNKVHTIIHPDLLSPQRTNSKPQSAAPGEKGLEIFSHEFSYATNSGLGVYQGEVRATGTNLSLTSETLTVLLPVGEHQFQSVTAEQDVRLTYNDLNATAAKAVYATGTGLAHLSGKAVWETGQRSGRGEELEIDPTNKILRAEVNAALKMPGRLSDHAVAARGNAASQPPSAAQAPAEPSFVTVQCEAYELRTNSSVFRNHVVAEERAAEQLRGQIVCELLRLAYAGSNELQEVVAEKNVLIKQGEQEFSGGKAVYTATNSLLEVTEEPAWRAGERDGNGELIMADLQREEMTVRGKALMRLPAEEFGRTGQEPGAPGRAEISCDEYHLSRQAARFDGNARLEHPQMKMHCPRIDAQFSPDGGKISNIVAGPSVEFDLSDEKGKLHGTGDKAVYNYTASATGTNDSMELTGNPAKLVTDNGTVTNRVVILDRANHQLITPGQYGMWGIATSQAGNPKLEIKRKPR